MKADIGFMDKKKGDLLKQEKVKDKEINLTAIAYSGFECWFEYLTQYYDGFFYVCIRLNSSSNFSAFPFNLNSKLYFSAVICRADSG